MKCKHVRKNSLLLLDSELSKLKQLQIRQHLKHCPSCSQKVAELKDLYGVLTKPDSPAPSAFLWTRISAVINDFESSRTPWTTVIDHLPRLAAALGMFLLFAGGVGAGIFLGSAPQLPAASAVESLSNKEQFVQASGLDTFDNLTPQSISSVYAVFTFKPE